MTNTTYKYCEWVKIGNDAGDNTSISRLAYYNDKEVAPDGEGEVEPIEVVNLVKPLGVDGRYKHFEMEIAIDSDNHEALWTQEVDGAGGHALEDSTDNAKIGYFVVKLVKHDDTYVTVTFESGKVACIGAVSRYSNRDEVDFNLTVYTFVCWGTRSES